MTPEQPLTPTAMDVERPCHPGTTHRYRRVGRSHILCCVRCGQGKRDIVGDPLDAARQPAAQAEEIAVGAVLLERARIVAAVEAIEHPCHEACVDSPYGSGNYVIHADCQCASFIRGNVLAVIREDPR